MSRRLAAVLVLLLLALLLAGACGDDADEPTTTTGLAATEPAPSEAADVDPVDDGAGSTDPGPAEVLPGDVITEPGVQRLTVEVVRRLDHDPNAFTQGLEQAGDHLYESTGRRGESTLRRIDPATGAVEELRELDPDLFGEGLTVVGEEIVQLTWQAGRALRYDRATLDPVGEFTYTGEGWGLCHDGDRFWMSDGTATLTERDATFAVRSTLTVTRADQPTGQLNELECVADAGGDPAWILANVWYADEVLVIDPATGAVEAVIDAAPLVAEAAPADDDHVLNGIAALDDGTLLLSGKNWPTSFAVRVLGEDPVVGEPGVSGG